MEKHYCRVCGLYTDELPWGNDGLIPTYEICLCCGVEFGNEDYTIESTKKYRYNWLSKGNPWFFVNEKPKNWKLEEQFKNIPPKYR